MNFPKRIQKKKKKNMDNYFIYKIVFPNGKHYIGCSTNLDERKKSHLRQAKLKQPQCKVHQALKKHNIIHTFELIVIDDTANSKQEMFEKEIFYIQKYNSHIKNNKGYNMTLGGDGNHGYVFTKADSKKMSQRAIEKFSNPEQREKARERAIQQFSNPEAREQMSQIKKEHYQNNPETREKLSQIKKEHYHNHPEAREVHGEKMKEHYKNNPEAGKVHGEKIKALYENNPEARKSEKRSKLFKVFRKKNMEFIKEFEYQFEAIEYIKKEFNVNVLSSKISAVLHKKRKSTGGFVFEYV